jgi:hypothetical protein
MLYVQVSPVRARRDLGEEKEEVSLAVKVGKVYGEV